MASTQAPGLLSASRLITLFGSVLVALSSGTNYIYSAYAPQLGARLHLSHTQLNVVGLAGNVGVYIFGPIWGKIVDRRGPRIPLVGAFTCLLIGYNGIKHIFDTGIPDTATSISTYTIITLVICSFLTGLGGNAGLAASMNTTAKSFPDKARASMNGLVLSAFGLSAFYFSTISHAFFPGDTSMTLFMLAFGTSLPMILGLFIVRAIPLPLTSKAEDLEDGVDECDNGYLPVPGDDSSVVFSVDNSSRAQLLRHEYDESVASTYHVPQPSDTVELTSRRSTRPSESRGSLHRSVQDSTSSDGYPNIYGKMLWMTTEFWLIFSIMSLCSGTGLMYINNVGSISQALYADGNPKYDEVEASRWQAMQVSTISIGNFLGRILIGVISDFAKSRFASPRSYSLCIVSTLFILSQLLAINVFDVVHLWRASALLGVAYGCLFGLAPTIVIDWFGLEHLSENWGYVSLAPLVGANILSLAFGRNLDAHSGTPGNDTISNHTGLSPGSDADRQCFDGRECYVSTLYLTLGATMVALGLSVWAGWRDRRKAKVSKGEWRTDSTGEVVWEADD